VAAAERGQTRADSGSLAMKSPGSGHKSNGLAKTSESESDERSLEQSPELRKPATENK